MAAYTFTPGPSELYPTIPQHIQKALDLGVPSYSHRGEPFQKLVATTKANLRKALKIPDDYSLFFLGSATEAMERVIQNLVTQHSYHFVNGAFSKRFFQTAQELGKDAEKAEVELGTGFDLTTVSIPDHAEILCFTHCETSTGLVQPLDEIYSLRKRHPEKLLAIDAVSTLPYADIDYSQVDATFFSVQKGFGLPAGLGVLILSPRCLKKALQIQEQGISIGSYHNFPTLTKFAEKNQTPETPNVLNIFLLGQVVQDLLNKGLDRVRMETESKAKNLAEMIDNTPGLDWFVENPHWRSPTVAVIKVANGANLRAELEAKGFFVGTGYGANRDHHIRIGNFPQHSIEKMAELGNLLHNMSSIKL